MVKPHAEAEEEKDMNSTPHCQSWCDEHDDEENECRTLRFLYRQKDREPEPLPANTPPEIVEAREALVGMGGFPAADTFIVDAYYNEAESSRVGLILEIDELISDKNTVDPTRKLHTDLNGLKEIHEAIGAFIKEVEGHGRR